MKTVSIITPCYNEAANVEELYNRVRAEMVKLGKYRYEHVFIDNSSKDQTVVVLKSIAARDHNVKIIVNARNFGHVRSPIHAILQTQGDCVIGIVADFQDPPELIPEMVAKWEEGYSMVLCVKRTSQENPVMFWLRKKFYWVIQRLSEIDTFDNFTGFGLFDRKVVEAVRAFGDPYPYFRGMIAEIGLPHYELPYDQPTRKRGITKNNFYTLWDIAMLGITNLSKVPLRFVTFLGFAGAALSMLTGLGYLVYKLTFWANFTVGIAPLVIGLFFLGSVQLLAMGILGEYIGSIHTQVQKRPYVIEKERVNFEYSPSVPLVETRSNTIAYKAFPDMLENVLADLGSSIDIVTRQTSSFESIVRDSKKIVVFGRGHLGGLAFLGAVRAGFEVLAFADNNQENWGRLLHGIPTMSPKEAVSRFNETAFFVVAIYNGTSPRNQLHDLGCKSVVPYPLFFGQFSSFMPEEDRLDLPHRILAGAERMRQGYEVLSDPVSRAEFANQVRWRCTLDYGCLAAPASALDMYYEPGLIELTEGEVLVDCGAFDGDSIRMFLNRTAGSFRHIYALEPDPRNLAALQAYRSLLPEAEAVRMSILPFGASDRSGKVSFNATGTVGSSIVEAGGSETIECRRLDDLLGDPAPTFIKMDIEGAEPSAIAGATAIIRTARPILAVCAYHKCEHLWTLPVLIKTVLPEYQLFLRRYAEECWETVYYAIPPERLINETGLAS